MATLAIRDLRIQARKAGVTNFRELDEDELKAAIKRASGGNGSSSTKKATKAVKTVVKKRGRPRKVVEDDEEDEPVVKRRGRPPGSGTKKAVAKAAPARRGRPAGTTKAKTSKTTTRKSTNGVGRPAGSGNGTRVTVPDRIKWNRSFDFREGSTADYILIQLRKSAAKYDDTDDIREDTIEKLETKLNKVDELTFNNRATGKAHKGDSAIKMLRYRVNRTILDFCIETGQHEGSTISRPNVGTTKKVGRPAKATKTTGATRGRPRKVVEDDDEDEEETKPRRGRPKGSGNKTTTARRGRPPKTEAVAKKRGRPVGSGKKTVAKRGRPRSRA